MHRTAETLTTDDSGSLLDAVLLISSDLDLRGALERLVRAASALTGARYGFLALLDDNSAIADFVVHGVSPRHQEMIARVPVGHGLLGLIREDTAGPLRVDHIGSHPAAYGFPANHPKMETFLGVPVRVDGRVYGNLYLAEKAGGQPFDATDERLVDEFAQIAGVVIANARVHTSTETRHRWLEASLAMSHALDKCATTDGALDVVVQHLCNVADAFAVGAAREDAGELELVAAVRADGGYPDPEPLVERWSGPIAQAAAEGQAVLVDGADGMSRMVVPMSSRLLRGHYLLVGLESAKIRIDGPDLELFTAFADQASLALDRTQALAERQEHLLVVDRDRIARDLHDTVIQRLFATGLQLQGLRRKVAVEEVQIRLDESVSELNETIRDIRSTIFELRRQVGAPLNDQVRDLAQEYVPVLGFTPFVRIRGPVDEVLPPQPAEQLVATLREVLSNVAKHAQADACIVEVEASADQVTLRVSDNGRGMPPGAPESGLRNVRRRAFDQGGTCQIAAEEPHGTRVEWAIPV